MRLSAGHSAPLNFCKAIVFFLRIMYTRDNISGKSAVAGCLNYKEEHNMKVARFVLKIVALSLTAAAAVCALIAYWDKLGEVCGDVKTKIQQKASASEYEDYEE